MIVPNKKMEGSDDEKKRETFLAAYNGNYESPIVDDASNKQQEYTAENNNNKMESGSTNHNIDVPKSKKTNDAIGLRKKKTPGGHQRLNAFSPQEKLLAEAMGLSSKPEVPEKIANSGQTDTTKTERFPVEKESEEETETTVADSSPGLKRDDTSEKKRKQNKRPVSLAPPELLEEINREKEMTEDENHVANNDGVPPGMRYSLHLKAIRLAKQMMAKTKKKIAEERETQIQLAQGMMAATEISLETQKDEWYSADAMQ
jgi:hypothetical protein